MHMLQQLNSLWLKSLNPIVERYLQTHLKSAPKNLFVHQFVEGFIEVQERILEVESKLVQHKKRKIFVLLASSRQQKHSTCFHLKPRPLMKLLALARLHFLQTR